MFSLFKHSKCYIHYDIVIYGNCDFDINEPYCFIDLIECKEFEKGFGTKGLHAFFEYIKNKYAINIFCLMVSKEHYYQQDNAHKDGYERLINFYKKFDFEISKKYSAQVDMIKKN